MNVVMNLRISNKEYIDQLSGHQLLKQTVLEEVWEVSGILAGTGNMPYQEICGMIWQGCLCTLGLRRRIEAKHNTNSLHLRRQDQSLQENDFVIETAHLLQSGQGPRRAVR